jgi:hypothetical protein
MMPSAAPKEPAFHFVTVLWGEAFCRLFLKVTVPNQLSPGNLPAIQSFGRSVYKIYTDAQTVAKLAESPEMHEVARYLRVEYVPMDDINLATTPSHVAMNLCQNRAIVEGAKEDAYLVFLSPDAIWSDGSFSKLVQWAKAGKLAVLHIAFRVALVPFLHELLRRHRDRSEPAMTIPPRELAQLVLKHLYPFYKKNFFNSKDFSPLPSHIYWQSGENAILARGFHLHPLMVKPSSHLEQSDVTIDFDFALRACRDPETIHIVSDSDEILATDLTDTRRYSNVVLTPCRSNFWRVLSFCSYSTNEYCRRLIRARYWLHSEPLSGECRTTEQQSDRVVRWLEICFPFLSLITVYLRSETVLRAKASRVCQKITSTLSRARQIAKRIWLEADNFARRVKNSIRNRLQRIRGRLRIRSRVQRRWQQSRKILGRANRMATRAARILANSIDEKLAARELRASPPVNQADDRQLRLDPPSSVHSAVMFAVPGHVHSDAPLQPVSAPTSAAVQASTVNQMPVKYLAQKYPSEFEFQDPATFLLNGRDMHGWGYKECAPYITENLNRERHRFFSMAVGFLHTAGVVGDYHEYGCYSATSFRMMLSEAFKMGLDRMNFFAFDSFEGLPEIKTNVSEHSNWRAGSMAMSQQEFVDKILQHGIYADRVRCIPGWFDRSLTSGLQEEFQSHEQPIALATVDCDLYESAVPVFRFIEPLLQDGSLIYIDDYYAGYRGSPRCGVAGAFHDYEKHSAYRFQPFLNVGWWGKSFIAYKDA